MALHLLLIPTPLPFCKSQTSCTTRPFSLTTPEEAVSLFCFEFSRTVLKEKKIQREKERKRGKNPNLSPPLPFPFLFPSLPSPFGCKQVGSCSLNVSDYKSEVGCASGGQPLFAGGQAAVGHLKPFCSWSEQCLLRREPQELPWLPPGGSGSSSRRRLQLAANCS